MDSVAIATLALDLLVPYAKKAAESFAGEAGKTAYAKVGSLFAAIKRRFAGEVAANDTLARFEQSPERYRPFLQDVIAETLKRDAMFRDEVAQLLADIREAAPQLTILQRMKDAESVVGMKAGEMSTGQVVVEQDIGTARSVTGVEIDRIRR